MGTGVTPAAGAGAATVRVMQRAPDGTLYLSATDLTNHLACAHLSEQRRLIALGRRRAPHSTPDPHADLVRRRGDEHEQHTLERLSAECGGHVDLAPGGSPAGDVATLLDRSRRTQEAMRDGAPLIFQGTLVRGRWHGRFDFLRRVDVASDLGGHAYEVLDTKLSRHVKPHMVHQLCLYSWLAAGVQGAELPTAAVILGDSREERVELARFAALHRHARARLEADSVTGVAGTYPEPVEHCAVCSLAAECARRRRDDDHLSLVANARRDHRARLVAASVPTLGALADVDVHAGATVPGLAAERLATLGRQASLQRTSRETGEPTRHHLPAEAARGLALLPPPRPLDVYFDLEGDPHVGAAGIEYLWGWTVGDEYHAAWAHSPADEKRALERFVDAVDRLRASDPGLHVYHYAPHESSTLRRLAQTYGTREDEVDDWLRRGVLVDLLQVVRQSLQVGEESYSLKHLERHHGFVRHQTSVRAGGGSIIAYEHWLETGDQAYLDAIRDYNREDCESTRSLHLWLWRRMRPEAEERLGVAFTSLTPPDAEAGYDAPKWMPEVEELTAGLHAGLPDDPAGDTPAQAERRLAGHLLLYHHRENKPQWWRHFALRAMTPEDLVDEADAVGLLVPTGEPPERDKRSLRWAFTFPPQEVKLKPGDAVDPSTGANVTLVGVDIDAGRLVLSKRAPKKDPVPPAPAHRALVAPAPIDATTIRAALMDVARAVRDDDGRYGAARALLRREPPAADHAPRGAEVGDLVSASLELTGGYLAVQGPPGTGKTFCGAHMIVAALRSGRRVAVTANSHAAIQNLVRAVEDRAHQEGVTFRGVYKGDGYDSPYGLVETGDNAAAEKGDHALVAGTAWLLTRDAFTGAFDTVFVDEAGQYALASAVAVARCARGIVLLGDPQQLPQVNQATHPGVSGTSALGHVIGAADVIDPAHGVLLETTWRLHPDVCAFISELSYEGLLHPQAACAHRRLEAPGRLTGTGLRSVPVAHDGCSQESPEEADTVAGLCRELLDAGTLVDGGERRPLQPRDILVVAPYNLAVGRLRRTVPDGVPVGTVDLFQGQEAPVVIFAMTSSSGEDVPRGLDFVFDRNRLNVALSRAQCLAVLVHSPRLLDADCRTLDQMALVNGACRFVEMAREV